MTTPMLVIACGAIARELVRIKHQNNWHLIDFQCLAPSLHNRPDQLVAAVERAIIAASDEYERIFVAYGDCGTGGQMDSMLDKYQIGRLPGAHCYEFLAGTDVFNQLFVEEPGSFYLTDFLTRHFRRLVFDGLGLDRHPHLLTQYFGNYKRVVYLAQTMSADLDAMAREHAACLGLEYEFRFCGDQPLACVLQQAAVAS